jgi:hypothetical protein
LTLVQVPGRFAFWMRALGRDDLPHRLESSGRTLRHRATAKHDFWAATGIYQDDAGGWAVLKAYRTARFAGAPLRWLGRWQCGREVELYRHLAGLSCVPALLGRVSDTAYLRAFVPGRPLADRPPVPAGFWANLDGAMRAVHSRGVAYVDSNKPENILIGEDGRPYLIDFQIAWRCGPRAHAPRRWWLARLQREDLYHVLKHKRRFARESMTPDELETVRRRSLLIRVHRTINRPYRMVRRPLLRWLRRTGRVLPSGSN